MMTRNFLDYDYVYEVLILLNWDLNQFTQLKLFTKIICKLSLPQQDGSGLSLLLDFVYTFWKTYMSKYYII